MTAAVTALTAVVMAVTAVTAVTAVVQRRPVAAWRPLARASALGPVLQRKCQDMSAHSLHRRVRKVIGGHLCRPSREMRAANLEPPCGAEEERRKKVALVPTCAHGANLHAKQARNAHTKS